MPIVGAATEVREPDETIHQITRQIKDEVQAQTGLVLVEFEPIKYRSQLVNGTNYFIKVRHAPNQHMHLRVYRSFQGDLSLAAFQLDKNLEDELAYFQ